MLWPTPCRFVSDAVTGVAIVTILFFFPSRKPSLKWWFDFKGKMLTAGIWGLIRTGQGTWEPGLSAANHKVSVLLCLRTGDSPQVTS